MRTAEGAHGAQRSELVGHSAQGLWGAALGACGAQARSLWGAGSSRAALLAAFEICRPAINVGDGLE